MASARNKNSTKLNVKEAAFEPAPASQWKDTHKPLPEAQQQLETERKSTKPKENESTQPKAGANKIAVKKNDDEGPEWFLATKKRDLETIRLSFSTNALNTMVTAKFTRWDREVMPLHLAVAYEQTRAVQQLIDAKADANAGTKENGWTPLQYAVKEDHFCNTEWSPTEEFYKIAQHLIAGKADVNVKQMKGRLLFDGHGEPCETLLHFTAYTGRLAMVKVLIEAKADVNAKTEESGKTPLHFASTVAVVKELLSANADINAKNKAGTTRLYWTARHCWTNDLPILQELLAAKADFDRDDSDRLLLCAANASLSDSDSRNYVMTRALDAKANPNVVDENGRSALYTAVHSNLPNEVQRLIDAKADTNTRSSPQLCFFHCGKTKKNKELLLEAKIDLSAGSFKTRDYPTLCRNLLSSKEGINLVANDLSNTALHLAVMWDMQDMTRILLDAKADVNAKNDKDKTPLDLGSRNLLHASDDNKEKILSVLLLFADKESIAAKLTALKADAATRAMKKFKRQYRNYLQPTTA